MAEEIKETQAQTPLLDAFMKAGKISVYESGLERPDYIHSGSSVLQFVAQRQNVLYQHERNSR